ncbi:MAG: hypothetical protein AB7T49_00075 [Oligoflexales bacterium]
MQRLLGRVSRELKLQKPFSNKVIFSILLGIGMPAYSVTGYRKEATHFLTNPNVLKPSLALDISDSVETVKIPISKIKARLERSSNDPRIEPLQIIVPKDSAQLSNLVKRIANPGKADELEEAFIKKLRSRKTSDNNSEAVELGKNELKLINQASYALEMGKSHHNVKVSTEILRDDPKMRKEFFMQMKAHLSSKEIEALRGRIMVEKSLSLDEDLLPPFARKMVKKYTIYRGPNCFHAALAFHSQYLTRSPLVNVKEEEGYHKAMINYDELWRAINDYFYEVDPAVSPLKYGDMLVFFNIPDDGSPWISYKWIRHTATYLFNNLTFSKGSKSPNTPYTVKTLEEEWKTWDDFTQKLGVKVFRRHMNKIKSPPPPLTDWIY